MDEGLLSYVDEITSGRGLSLHFALNRIFRLGKTKLALGEAREVAWFLVSFFVWFMSRFLTAFFDHDMRI